MKNDPLIFDQFWGKKSLKMHKKQHFYKIPKASIKISKSSKIDTTGVSYDK